MFHPLFLVFLSLFFFALIYRNQIHSSTYYIFFSLGLVEDGEKEATYKSMSSRASTISLTSDITTVTLDSDRGKRRLSRQRGFGKVSSEGRLREARG